MSSGDRRSAEMDDREARIMQSAAFMAPGPEAEHARGRAHEMKDR